MRYMVLIHNDESEMAKATPAQLRAWEAEYAAFNEALLKAGVGSLGQRLRPSAAATSVRIRNGETEVVDGPYADTREQLGGFFTVDVPDLEQAVAWAARCPSAAHGTIEIRPLWEQPGTQA